VISIKASVIFLVKTVGNKWFCQKK